jgi:hypothetical protein
MAEKKTAIGEEKAYNSVPMNCDEFFKSTISIIAS